MTQQTYEEIKTKVDTLSEQRGKPTQLIAVSKTKPKEAIQHLYETYNHRVFGENYIQELNEKGNDLLEKCPEIQWHFIGRIQSNKLKLLLSTPNLKCIQTVHSVEIAEKMEKILSKEERTLDIMIQINSSEEEQKNGINAEDAIGVIEEVMKFKHLHFIGIMTIGMVGDARTNFTLMKELAEKIKNHFGLENLEVSMGMSADFDIAIELGATMVRVGTALFGARNYNK